MSPTALRSALLPLVLSLGACGTTAPTTTPDATATSSSPEEGIKAAAAARMAEELGCRGLKHADVELVRTTTKGDDLIGETMVAGCGELKRYTIVCRTGVCAVPAEGSGQAGDDGGDPMAIVAEAAVARVKQDSTSRTSTSLATSTDGDVRRSSSALSTSRCGGRLRPERHGMA